MKKKVTKFANDSYLSRYTTLYRNNARYVVHIRIHGLAMILQLIQYHYKVQCIG